MDCPPAKDYNGTYHCKLYLLAARNICPHSPVQQANEHHG